MNDLQKESYEQGSRRLNEELLSVGPDELADFLKQHSEALITSPHPFTDYMRKKFREKGVLQQNVFLAADLSESYGYKLIAEEKHTRRRDTILRLCFAAGFGPQELREALILYGMAPLHARFPRDAVLLVAAQCGLHELRELNRLLERCGQAPLVKDYE